MSTTTPPIFDNDTSFDYEACESPFLKPSARSWALQLPLKISLLSALCFLFSFIFSFFSHLSSASNVLLLITFFLSGTPSLIDAVEDLFDWEINIDILMTLAAFLSVILGNSLEGGLLLVLFDISGTLESSVMNKARGALSTLHKLSPKKASVILEDGTIFERSIEDIAINTHILVKAGEVVPLDGNVISGHSSVSLVHLTGENLPVTKGPGDPIPAGAHNQDGALTVCVTQTSSNSTLSKIIHLVTSAQDSKPKLQRWIDKISGAYAIGIILATIILAATLPFLFNLPFWGDEGSLYRSLAFLIAASPCALIIAIPITYLSAVSICAKQGILLKGGVVLDALAQCKIIAFDKTGTLTTGKLHCTGIEIIGQHNLEDALGIAHSLERQAHHPIAQAVVDYVTKKKIPPTPLTNIRTLPGYGVEGTHKSSSVAIGHAQYISEKLPPEMQIKLSSSLEKIYSSGEVLTVLMIRDSIIIFRFADTVRKNMAPCIKELSKIQKLKLLMLTGDHQTSAARVAKAVGLEEFHADLRPEDKLRYVSDLSMKTGLVMIGDGINDAPALARATVGISMGGVGSSATIDISDIVLLHDNIECLPWLIQRAQKTQVILKENLILATIVICFASLLALAGIVPLWLAVILHEGGTVLVGLNGLRLLKK